MLRDIEFTVVHELIHLEMVPVLSDLQRTQENRREEEHAVNHMAEALLKLDRDLPLQGMRTLDEQIKQNVQTDRIVLQLAAVFAGLATALAMLGLYGVMAHSVTRRTREIGIRMALGAEPGRIRRMVMRELLWI